VTLDGRLAETVTVRGGETARFSYDSLGRLVSAVVGERTTSYTYDDAGQLVRSRTSDGDTIEYDYDATGD
jgi:YD repeat-containing protein